MRRASSSYTDPSGGVGYFSNERGFSVESRLQRISSKFLLWKRNDSSGLIRSHKIGLQCVNCMNVYICVVVLFGERMFV